MQTSIRRTAAVPAVVAAIAIALTAFAAPVLAKEALDAQLEAPIARDTPGGTTLLLGVWLTMTDETGTHDIDGSPVYVRVTGPDGGSTVARATQTSARPLRRPDHGARERRQGGRGRDGRLDEHALQPRRLHDRPGVDQREDRAGRPARTRRDRARGARIGAGAARGPAGRPRRGSRDHGHARRGAGRVRVPARSSWAPLVLAAAALATLAIVRRVRIAAHPRLSGRSPGA